VGTIYLSLLTLSALAADPEVEVRPLVGESVTGRLKELSASKAVITTPAGPQEFATDKLMWLLWPAATSAEKTPLEKTTVWIDLEDGSKLTATGYTAADGKAQITIGSRPPLEIPTRAIHTVRFRQQSPELALQWREITSSQSTGDLIVMRKTSMRTVEQGDNEARTVTEQALDQLEGTLLAVTDDSVLFEVEGQKVPARREKLEGLVYYHPAKRDFPAPICRLVESNGSTWLLRDLQLAGGRLTATTPANVSIELPLAAISKLDFSVGNVMFLSDLEADSGAGEPSLGLQPSAMSYKFGRVFQVRNRPPLGADSFRIAGRKFDNGLSLHSPVKLVYRVPEGFRKFIAIAGVDDSIVAPGCFNLIITGDGKELARHSFNSDQSRQAIPIELDLSNVRRVSIALEAADGQDIGDQLDLCEARFTK
jgi:hypothetical protein